MTTKKRGFTKEGTKGTIIVLRTTATTLESAQSETVATWTQVIGISKGGQKLIEIRTIIIAIP